MKSFTKKQLSNIITYDSNCREATICVQFLFQEHISILMLLACVENFIKNMVIPTYSYSSWLTKSIKINLCIDKVLVIESSWLNEMIKMYKDDWEMQVAVTEILSLFILCDKFVMAQKDDSIIQFKSLKKEDRTNELQNILNSRVTLP